jgi:hypothetical protein
MLMRGAAVLDDLLFEQHSGFPYRLFDLLSTPTEDFGQQLLNGSPKCLRDEFSHAHLTRFNTTETLLSDESLSCLRATALLTSCDIGAIEARHAQVRRVALLTTAVPSKLKTLVSSSSDFLLMRAQRQIPNRKHRTHERDTGMQNQKRNQNRRANSRFGVRIGSCDKGF